MNSDATYQHVLTVTRSCTTVVVAGTQAEQVVVYLEKMLRAGGKQIAVHSLSQLLAGANVAAEVLIVRLTPETSFYGALHANIFIATDVPRDAEELRQIKRIVRNLPSAVHLPLGAAGIVIAPAKEGLLRKISKGFAYRFRWEKVEYYWPGTKRLTPPQDVSVVRLAARAAHELGVSQHDIRTALQSPAYDR